MITYVNTVLVGKNKALATAAPAAAANMSTPSADAGKYIIMNCDDNIAASKLYVATAADASVLNKIKIGMVTSSNTAVHKTNGTVQYLPIVKWSGIINAHDVRDFKHLKYQADTEDSILVDLTNLSTQTANLLAEGNKRILVRVTYKDLPTRYRKWTESYEYMTKVGDDATKICAGIAAQINSQWKRARVQATATGKTVTLVALPYDDDNSAESINWANKVRFNVNMYYTDPQAAAFASRNKYYLQGVTITMTPGIQYAASAKLVRDRESIAQGYEGIMNRTWWPVIKPAIQTDINGSYDGLVVEFENMYRTADDLFRKTKQTVELYDLAGSGETANTALPAIKTILAAFTESKKNILIGESYVD